MSTTIRETPNFTLYRTRTGRHYLRTDKGVPAAVRISKSRDVEYLRELDPSSFDASCVWDFGCGGFANK